MWIDGWARYHVSGTGRGGGGSGISYILIYLRYSGGTGTKALEDFN